jgi:CHAT domain-containing protein
MNRRLAGLAEAFFECGIQNYIGAAWPVDDEPAVEFAKVFYKNALLGETLGFHIMSLLRNA